jgi:WD40 repeat protein
MTHQLYLDSKLKRMFKFFLIMCLILINAKHSFTQNATFLRINPNGHMGQIREVVISNDNKYLVTCSFDKTIKKWEIETGKIVMEYRGHIGQGSDGMVYQIALSPDNKYLAAGGWFGATDESEVLGDIRIFDFATGKMIKVLKGHEGTPVGLGFSNDSKYLICGDENSNIIKWDMESGKAVSKFVYHPIDYGKTLFKLEVNNDFIISIDWVGHVCLWDINNSKKPLKIEKKFIKKVLANDIGPIAISPNQKDIVVSINHFIIFFNEQMKFTHLIERKNESGFIKFSEDGQKMLVGCYVSGDENRYCSVFSKNPTTGKFEDEIQYRGHQNTVIAGGFISNNEFITAGGENDEIHIWKINNDKSTQLVKEFIGVGQIMYGSGLNNQTIGFTSEWTENFGKSTLIKSFDLFLKEFQTIEKDDFRKPTEKWENFSFGLYNTGVMANIFSGLILKKGDKATDTIMREYWNGSSHDSFTFTENGFVISGGSYGVLKAYNRNAIETNTFIGHEGDVWGCALSSNGKRLITCGNDKTIRIWPLEKVGLVNPKPPTVSVREAMQELEVPLDETVYKKIFTQIGVYHLADTRTYEAWETIVKKLKEGNWPCTFLVNKLNDMKTTNIYPIVSLFFTEAGEWVIWNQEGYFTSSKNGAQYVGYHINQGVDKEAKFYPFEQFDLKFNRPDIILQDLEIGYEGIIDFYKQSYIKRLKKHGLNLNDLQEDIHAPEMEIVSFNKDVKGDFASVTIKASDSKYPLDRIMVYINGVPVYGKKGVAVATSQKINKTLELELAKGTNKIELSVFNEKGTESFREYIVIENGDPVEKPNLYIVAIGTSNYKNKKFNLKYAAKDAKDMVETFKSDPLYNQVYSRVIVDEEVTANNILLLKNFLGGATRNDVVMVFVAGHGLLDANLDYYYAAYDVDFDNPKNNGIPYENIENLLEGIRSLKKLLIMDTCHSGELDAEEVEIAATSEQESGDVQFRSVASGIRKKQGAGLKNTSEMVKELFVDLRKGTGATVISSSGGAEYAMESSSWKNGLFTYCLLNGLKTKKADFNNDGLIVLSELKMYVQNEVAILSKGKQTPTSRIENLTVDYGVWK